MKSKGGSRKKKSYSRPRLVAYGDFRALTRATTKGGGATTEVRSLHRELAAHKADLNKQQNDG